MTACVKIVKSFLAAENERDWELWASFLHPEVQYTVIGSTGVVQSRDNYVRHMQETYDELPDWQFRIVHILGDERTVIVEFDGAGHFSGAHRGQQHEQAPLKLQAVCVFELKDSLIYRVREYFDAVGYERQLGQFENED